MAMAIYNPKDPDRRPPTPAERLAWATIGQAVRDARIKNNPARRTDALIWLHTEAPLWLDALGINPDPQAWAAWIFAGCPGRPIGNHARKDLQHDNV